MNYGGIRIPQPIQAPQPVPPPQPPKALLIPIDMAIKQLQLNQYGYITHLEIASLVQQLAMEDGMVDIAKATLAVKQANVKAKADARRTRAPGVSNSAAAQQLHAAVKSANRQMRIETDPLAIRQAESIIESKL